MAKVAVRFALDQQLKWDEVTNQSLLITKFSDGSVSSETLTSEEASLWQAEHSF